MQESVKYQYLAVLTVNILVMSCGAGLGWSSPSIKTLMSNGSPLPTGRITKDESSWIASLWNVGGLIGNFLFGYITSKFGRKLPIIFMAIPNIGCWLFVLFAQNVYYLYVSRILYGIVVGGVFVVVPLFIAEISNDRVRGVLGSTKILTFNFGVLLALVLGWVSHYNTIPIFLIVSVTLFTILFAFFPESPTILVKQNQIMKAEKSIKFYRNLNGKSDATDRIQTEIKKLEKSLGKFDKSKKSSFRWSDLMQNPGKKALIIGTVLTSLLPLCGHSTIVSYAANIFEASGSIMKPNLSAAISGILLLIGSLIATFLVERAGRRFLYIVSTTGTTLALISLGIYLMLKSLNYNVDAFNWIPIGSISMIAFLTSWAILHLPFVVISEILPENLKDFGSTLCMTLKWIIGFIITKFFPEVTELLGLYGAMFMFASFCLFGAIFVTIMLPETKGKSYEEIMILLQ